MNKKNNRSGSKMSWIGVIAGMLCLALVAVAAVILDRQMNENAIQADTYSTDEEHRSYARGTVTLGGTIYEYYHNFENYLFIGTDEEEDEEDSGNPAGDFLMLLSIDRSLDTYTIIELNGDTMTQVNVLDAQGNHTAAEQMQLSLASTYGTSREQGFENQVKAVSSLLGGIPISGYLSLSVTNMDQFNQLVGGVTLTLLDDFTDLDPEMKKGATLELTDEQAYYYLHQKEQDRTDTEEKRLARQRQYMEAFLEQGVSKVQINASYFQDIFNSLGDITTTGLTTQQLLRIATALSTDEAKGVVEISGETKTERGKASEFYVDTESLVDVMTETFGLEAVREAITETITEGDEK